jgi:hypothetical protein
MIGSSSRVTQTLDVSRKQTIAAQILHSEIDQLRLQSWPTVAGYSSSGVAIGSGYASSTTLASPTITSSDPSFVTFVSNYPNAAKIFTLVRTVSCVKPSQSNPNPSAYSSEPLLLQVTFTISWKGITGRSYSRISTTYVGFNGLYQSYQKS